MTIPGASRGRFLRYGRIFGEIAGVSAVGILATAGFQLVVIRGLGSSGYGVLAALLALVNLISVGSAALRNSVAVATATADPDARRKTSRWDATLVEAVVLGVLGTVVIGIIATILAGPVDAGPLAVVLIAATALPYFFFARAQGRLQGMGRARAVVWWSTGAQVAQLVLAALTVFLGWGVGGVLGVLVLTAVIGALGATRQARAAAPAHGSAFSRQSTIVLLATIAFTWMTTADVVLVKAGTEADIAGSYAAAAMLVKTTLIIPATLSLYLLPRLAARGADSRMVRTSMSLSLLATTAGGLAMIVVALIAGEFITRLLFGPGYGASAEILPWVAVMWLPWAVAQAALIRALAIASLPALLGLGVGVVVQWLAVSSLLPDLGAALVANGVVGALVAGWLFLIHVLEHRIEKVRADATLD